MNRVGMHIFLWGSPIQGSQRGFEDQGSLGEIAMVV